MDSKAKHDRQLRVVAIATLASIVAAVAAMFVPAAMLESVTGATGVSEIFPATAAPLGDTARALIAFGSGVVMLAVLMVALLRRDAEPAQADWNAAGIPETDDDLTPTWKERFAGLGLPTLKLPQMPWVKGEDDITDFADLPKLRNGDVHPDAPARRPLLATQDLPVLDLPVATIEPVAAEPVDNSTPPVALVEQPAVASTTPDVQPSLAEMVAQLEASVAQRQQQLADLEIVAANLAASKTEAAPAAVEALTEPMPLPKPDTVFVAEPVRPIRPVLEAVPDSPPPDDDMDAALAAALATLHRMNGTG